MKLRLGNLWPLGLALAGVAMLAYTGWKLASAPDGDDDGDAYVEPEPPSDLLEDAHFEKVRKHEIQELKAFKGRFDAEGTREIRAPQGMRVPVIEIHKWEGQFVEEGDPLFTFAGDQIRREIEKAKEAGRDDLVERFEGYLEFEVIRSPVKGQVLNVWVDLGNVPLDEGIPLATLTDRSGWSFVALIPEDVARTAANIGATVPLRLDDDLGETTGTITALDAVGDGPMETVGGFVNVVIDVDEQEGIEKGLAGAVMLPTAALTVGLVPRDAVRLTDEAAGVVRVWEDGEVLERTVALGGTHLDDYIVRFGVYPGESVVVPGPGDE